MVACGFPLKLICRTTADEKERLEDCMPCVCVCVYMCNGKASHIRKSKLVGHLMRLGFKLIIYAV